MIGSAIIDSVQKKKLSYKTDDDIDLVGILTRPPTPSSEKGCVIMCHGITVDKDEGGTFVGLSKSLYENDFSSFRFDYRGHGESGGKPAEMTITGEHRDLQATIRLVRELGYRKLFLLGASFACGSVALELSQNEDDFEAVVLWNPVVDYESLLEPRLPWSKKYFGPVAEKRAKEKGYTKVGSHEFPVGYKLFKEMREINLCGLLSRVRLPILFIHGDCDTYIPYEDTKKCSELVENGELYIAQGSEHGFHDENILAVVIKKTVGFFDIS
ncbi:alpha/beta fold hydrolase [Candidatus Dojkabacteria bacterium]|nr:alpha/beta fold hydrolase [Candidatus Dojkabacteria bacterium]